MMKKSVFFWLLLSASIITNAQNEASMGLGNKHLIGYAFGMSHLHIYYEPDSLADLWKDTYFSHIVEYDRRVFPFLDAGAFMLYSTKDIDLLRVNVLALGVDVRFLPLGLFCKEPKMIDFYGIFRGGVACLFLSNFSGTMLSQLHHREHKQSELSQYHAYLSPGFGIAFFNKHKINLFFEYSRDKGFKNTYRFGASYRL